MSYAYMTIFRIKTFLNKAQQEYHRIKEWLHNIGLFIKLFIDGIRDVRLKVINVKRLLIFFIMLVICSAVFGSILISNLQVNKQSVVRYVNVYTTNGDTLWDIAKEYNNNKLDIRQYVEMILIENNMESSMIKAGQVLKVPIFNNVEIGLAD
ncbi:LysM peptidoglycan-binding domain-containing protein [Petroclostridium sp. X23]|uniref:cell division suppressor protein YneA n=1 Tax=Petroclostridium sp. X23 TaxID=3045146 RepID=UPI0024ACB4C7|nr:LysM peptidoglycan-binding domain-containing protein [Petroclostridium sp. X23]WHH61304.1 LysM peptidoglycan-binding domain-containing protein [Petroclostridium sp. X23]